jgi:hypothetical protein
MGSSVRSCRPWAVVPQYIETARQCLLSELQHRSNALLSMAVVCCFSLVARLSMITIYWPVHDHCCYEIGAHHWVVHIDTGSVHFNTLLAMAVVSCFSLIDVSKRFTVAHVHRCEARRSRLPTSPTRRTTQRNFSTVQLLCALTVFIQSFAWYDEYSTAGAALPELRLSA